MLCLHLSSCLMLCFGVDRLGSTVLLFVRVLWLHG